MLYAKVICYTRQNQSKLIVSPKILDLSSYSLSKTQEEHSNERSEGLKFTPTPK